MGREVKRVHIDFDWFEKKSKPNEDSGWAETWYGYVLEPIKCMLCDGSGKNLKGKECPGCYDGKVYPRVEIPTTWDEKKMGYQMWQDVSEGSPISPVFKKPEQLAKWMVENDSSTTSGTSYKAWLKMIKEEGSAPSGVMSSEGFSSGMSLHEEKDAKEGEKE